jgi:TRAP-type uncharacterized transport system substrate-binding protein
MSYHISTVTQYFKRYVKKFLPKEALSWGRTAHFYGLIGLLGLLSVIALAVYVNPFPPRSVHLATGQVGSSYQAIGENFQKTFKRKGITLELVPTSGLGEGLQGLDSKDSKVSASFLTAGTESSDKHPDLISLGSIQYTPFWIFYRGESIQTTDPFEYFSDKKIAIGPAGNITNKIFRNLYHLNQNTAPLAENISEISSAQAADQLIAGKLDAAFISDDFRADTIQKLLADRNIKILHFPLAEAYIKKRPFLQKLVIPRGSIHLDSIYPEEDITILASTTLLLVEKDTHPAIQWAYLLAAQEYGRRDDSFFAKPEYFPRNLDQSYPLSPVASRFYAHGTPEVFSYLPFWLASLIENIWAYLLAFVVIVYPAYRLMAGVRLFPSEHLMNEMFIHLRELDEAILSATSKTQLAVIFETLNEYEKEINTTWLFGKNARFYFNLKNALMAVRRDADAKLKNLTPDT